MKRETTKNQEKQVMQNIISYHLADWCPACPWAVIGSFQVTPPVYILGMMSCGMEYPFGHFGSALLAMLLQLLV